MNRLIRRMLTFALAAMLSVSALAEGANLVSPTPTPAPSAAATEEAVPTKTPTVTPSPVGTETAAAPMMQFLSPTPDPVSESSIEDDGLLKVLLRSLGNPQTLNLTVDGAYAIEGDGGLRFERGATLTLFEHADSVWMEIGGLLMDMGGSVTFTRHAAEGVQGLRIAESEKDTLYCGDLTVSAEDGSLSAILTIDIEEYLYGVVAYEMSDSFPIEALKAQAVAARTYAMDRKFNAGTRTYHVVDTTADQVFKGYDGSYVNIIEAVDATKGVVGIYNGGFAACYYTASNGGQVATPNEIWGGSGDDAYIRQKDDPYDLENPKSKVNRVEFKKDLSDCSALKAMLTQKISEGEFVEIEKIEAIEPTAPNGLMFTKLRFDVKVKVEIPQPTPNPLQETMQKSIFGFLFATDTPDPESLWEERTICVELDVYEEIKDGLQLGLNGGDYETVRAEETEDGFAIEMRRFGHGVGMSQRGAQWMAGQYGATWVEILNFYYPGMALEKIDWQREPLTELALLPTLYGASRPDPTATPTPAPLPELEEGERYAEVALAHASSALNVREQPSVSAKVIEKLADGRRVIAIGEADADGWIQIRTAEFTGYVQSTYLRAVPAADC